MRRSGGGGAVPKSVLLALLLATAALGLLAGSRAEAQAPPALAGLVVRFGDGRAISRCVELGPQGRMNGVELLQAAGLDLSIEAGAIGAMVCRIEGDGCQVPAEPCLCRCRSQGPDCRYWAYHRLGSDGWIYQTLGPSARRLGPGDVDGWAWAVGEEGSGPQPPATTFEEICAERLALPSPGPVSSPVSSPGASPMPTATATATRSRATSAPRPTATRVPTRAPARPGASSATPRPPRTATARPSPSTDPVMATAASLGPDATSTAPPMALPPDIGEMVDRVLRATLSAQSTQLAAMTAAALDAMATATTRPSETMPAALSTPTLVDIATHSADRGAAGSPGARRGGRAADFVLTGTVLGLLAIAWWRARR